MGELKTDKTQKTSWFKGLKTEFKKIIWPNKALVAKEATAVIIVSVLLGGIIAIIDYLVQMGIDFIITR